METICVKAKIKKDAINLVRQWFQDLKCRKDEVLKTLEKEGVVIESVFLESNGDEEFLIYYMRANDIAHAHQVYRQSTLPIDIYHKDCWKNYCERGKNLELLLDFDRTVISN